jgi:hypothetical protein
MLSPAELQRIRCPGNLMVEAPRVLRMHTRRRGMIRLARIPASRRDAQSLTPRLISLWNWDPLHVAPVPLCASKSSISIAILACLKAQSAALRRVDAGAGMSTTISSVVVAVCARPLLHVREQLALGGRGLHFIINNLRHGEVVGNLMPSTG